MISRGGITVIELLHAHKPFVAFPNPRVADNHQATFLEQIATSADISWSRDVANLAPLYAERRAFGPAALRADFPRIADIVRESQLRD